jgi:hypothetical protein
MEKFAPFSDFSMISCFMLRVMPFLIFLSFCELPLGAIAITINLLLNKKFNKSTKSARELFTQPKYSKQRKGNGVPNAHKWASLIG